MEKRRQVQAELPKRLWDALRRAQLAAGGYGQLTRIIREALEAHPEVKRQLDRTDEHDD